MTYKHIGFSDSIVMKELEKVAYRTNLVQNDPEQEKVATKLTTTDDLFLDTITLATALRDNGFVKQAEKLEEKVLQYKIASKDDDKYNWWQETGSSLIDYSHQVDDYEEIPSAKGDGVVENQNEIHKILEDVLKHQPTGKVGSQNKEIVVMAINALGQDQTATLIKELNDSKKSAIEAIQEFKKDLNGKKDFDVLKVDDSTEKKIFANNIIFEKLPEAERTDITWQINNLNYVKGEIDYFKKMSNSDTNVFIDWVLSADFNNRFINPTFNNVGFLNLKNQVSNLVKNLRKKIVDLTANPGSEMPLYNIPASATNKQQQQDINTQLNPVKQKVSSDLDNYYIKLYNVAQKSNNKIKNILESAKNDIFNTINSKIEKIENLEFKNITLDPVISTNENFSKILVKIQQYKFDEKNGPLILDILIEDNMYKPVENDINNFSNKVIQLENFTSTFAKKFEISSIYIEKTSNIVSNLRKLSNLLISNSQESKEMEIQKLITLYTNVLEALSKNDSEKQFYFNRAYNKKNVDANFVMKDLDAADKGIKSDIAAWSKKLGINIQVVESSFFNSKELIKIGQWISVGPGTTSGSTKSQSVSQSVSGVASPGGSSQISTREGSEVATAVVEMQKMIIEYGKFANIQSIINLAKDGAWGPKTTAALSEIKKNISYNVKKAGEIREQKPEEKNIIIETANFNKDIMIKALVLSGDTRYSISEVFGSYIDIIPLSMSDNTIELGVNDGIMLTLNDLQSLGSLKNLLDKNYFSVN